MCGQCQCDSQDLLLEFSTAGNLSDNLKNKQISITLQLSNKGEKYKLKKIILFLMSYPLQSP